MGTKMAVAFAVIFMAHIEKQLLALSPHKPLIWKRFIDDIFSVWTLPKAEINNFIVFANSFHTTINSRMKCHRKRPFSWIPKFLKAQGSLLTKSWMFKHILSRQKRSNKHTSRHVTLSVSRRAFVKGEALRLLRKNSVKESFELKKLQFLTRLLERGYPKSFAEDIFTEIKFSMRNKALQNKPKTSEKIIPFVTTFNPATPNLKKILIKHWHLIAGNHNLARIFKNPPMVAYRKDKSLKDYLVRARIPSL